MKNPLSVSGRLRIVGILSIVMGGIAFIAMGLLGLFIWSVSSGIAAGYNSGDITWPVILVFSVLLALPSIVGIIGGIFSLKRTMWGWVLAGTICNILYFNILGIPALTLTILSKKEFRQDI
jgi:hypothetical protein